MDGNTVTQLSITPIPTNQPPFPLPAGVKVPVFFTIQPGGSQVIPPRAQLIYPNFTNQPAGGRIDFWNYDAEDKGWYIYGKGTVSRTASRSFLIRVWSCMSSPARWFPTRRTLRRKVRSIARSVKTEIPVDLGTGLFVYSQTDLDHSGYVPLALTRTYRPRDTVSRPFGIGATHPLRTFGW